MAAVLILYLALFSGAVSAFHPESAAAASKRSEVVTVLQQFPSVVQVEFLGAFGWWGWQQSCAASVLTNRFLLSAASCFSGPTYPSPSYRRIRAGAENRHLYGDILYVEKEINYRYNFTAGSFFEDISVIKLESFLVFSSLIRQASILPQGSITPTGLVLNQLGWGRENNHTYVALSAAPVTTISRPTNGTLQTNIITAMPSFISFYNLDVGSPWFWGTITVGVVPGGDDFPFDFDGTSKDLSVFATAVSAYTNWIVNVAR